MQTASSANTTVPTSRRHLPNGHVLCALLGIALTAPALGSLTRPVRVDRVEAAFRDVAILKGRAPVTPSMRMPNGMVLTYSFKADYDSTVKSVQSDLTARGWTRSEADRKCSRARFGHGMRTLTILRAKTAMERCPSTGRTWRRTTWPRSKRAHARATDPDPARGWITIECVLAEPEPSSARCLTPATA